MAEAQEDAEIEVPTPVQAEKVFSTQEGTERVLVAISNAGHYIDDRQKEIASNKAEIKKWEFHTGGVAKICAVIGIICAVISVLLGCFCGMYCLLFAIPAAICAVFTFVRGREASLDGYYNNGRREAIAKDEKEVEMVKEKLNPVLSLIPEDYSSLDAIDYMIKALEMGWAHDFSEAAKEWNEESHRRKVENMENLRLQSQLRTESAVRDLRDLEMANLAFDVYRDVRRRR